MPEEKERPVFEVGDTVRLKKKHPCGSFDWEILRVGADFRLRCTGCGRIVHLDCDHLKPFYDHLQHHHGFTIDHHASVLAGLCGRCAHRGGEEAGHAHQ